MTSINIDNSLDPLLTLAEVAKILRCSHRTIRRLIKSGRLRAVQTGRCYRFRCQDVSELVRRSLTTGHARPSEPERRLDAK
jgi:excisionase family DNA binding protein